jgi:hypothetical protein
VAETLRRLGRIAVEEGELSKAHRLFEESLGIMHRIGEQESITAVQADLLAVHQAEAGDSARDKRSPSA